MLTDDMAQRLDHSLDHIFGLLREGNLAGLKDALTDLESQLADSRSAEAAGSGAPVTVDALAGLRRKAERNAACLKGTARGLRAARRRIAEVRAAATGLAAYDAQGQRLDATAPGAGVNRRF